jgi:hypothetical protein
MIENMRGAKAVIPWVGATLVSIASWLSVHGAMPRFSAPFSLTSIVSAFIFGVGGVLAFNAVVFLAWHFFIARRTDAVPLPSVILFGVVVCLSGWWHVNGASYAVEYQGAGYTERMAIVNSTLVGVLVVALLANRVWPRAATSAVFHIGFFCWIAWGAFPWLGETP